MRQISTFIRLGQIRACWPGAMILSACPTLGTQTSPNILSESINQWHKSNVALVITLLDEIECHELGIARLVRKLQAEKITWHHFPILNMKAPIQGTAPYLENLVAEVASIFAKDRTIVIHCHAGLGRTGLIAATFLTSLGIKPEDAISKIRIHRPGCIETQPQEEFVLNWHYRLPEFPPGL